MTDKLDQDLMRLNAALDRIGAAFSRCEKSPEIDGLDERLAALQSKVESVIERMEKLCPAVD